MSFFNFFASILIRWKSCSSCLKVFSIEWSKCLPQFVHKFNKLVNNTLRLLLESSLERSCCNRIITSDSLQFWIPSESWPFCDEQKSPQKCFKFCKCFVNCLDLISAKRSKLCQKCNTNKSCLSIITTCLHFYDNLSFIVRLVFILFPLDLRTLIWFK